MPKLLGRVPCAIAPVMRRRLSRYLFDVHVRGSVRPPGSRVEFVFAIAARHWQRARRAGLLLAQRLGVRDVEVTRVGAPFDIPEQND